MSSTAEYDRAAEEIRRPGKEPTQGELNMKELVRLATLAASRHNTQPWKFRIHERAISVHPDFARRCPVVDPDDSHLFKSLGCAAENLVHAAATQGHTAEVSFDSIREEVIVRFERAPSVRVTELSPSAFSPSSIITGLPSRRCVN